MVVFDSAIEGFFLTHYDFLAKVEDTTSLPPGPTGLQPLPDMLVRLSRAPVVSIASIRGRATGVGSELALACDMRFASREKAILSQFEVGAGIVLGEPERYPHNGRTLSDDVVDLFFSIKKAITSRAFEIATMDLAKHSQSGGQFFGIHASNDGKIMIFAGGIPLKREGKVVGANRGQWW